MTETTRLEGRVMSVEIGEPTTGSSSYERKRPRVTFCIKDGSKETKSVDMLIDIGKNGELLKKATINQKISFVEKEERLGGYLYTTKKLTIKSGQCQGIEYEQIDEY